ncbi:hypothetical protein ACMGE6_10580 [Macrococcus equi]|uniref:hypothetical protein n=1 Tax=Macrococcus equi TaxID=3395462 RepID=UPI0039BE15F1
MSKEKKESFKEMLSDSIRKNYIVFLYVIVTISSAIFIGWLVAILITYPYGLNEFASGSTDGWLGFWGGLLGGLLGTVAVLVVASWQNSKQEEQLQKQNKKQEELLFTQIDYEKVKYQTEKIHKIILDIDDLKFRINDYYQSCETYADLILYGKLNYRAEQYQLKAEESGILIDKINTDIENLDKELENIVDEKLTITGASNIIHSLILGNDIGALIHYPEENYKKYHRLVKTCLDSLIEIQGKLSIVKYYLFDVLDNINNIKIDKEKLPEFHFKEQFSSSNTAKYYKEMRTLKEK